MQCTYGALTRNIEVVYSDPGQPVPCEVIYNKPMESSVQALWRANNEAGYCESQAEALIDKLSNFDWRCEPVAGSAAAQPPAELRLEDEISGAEMAPIPASDSIEIVGDEMLGDAPAAEISKAVEEAATADEGPR